MPRLIENNKKETGEDKRKHFLYNVTIGWMLYRIMLLFGLS
jgi:hypothetical protein